MGEGPSVVPPAPCRSPGTGIAILFAWRPRFLPQSCRAGGIQRGLESVARFAGSRREAMFTPGLRRGLPSATGFAGRGVTFCRPLPTPPRAKPARGGDPGFAGCSHEAMFTPGLRRGLPSPTGFAGRRSQALCIARRHPGVSCRWDKASVARYPPHHAQNRRVAGTPVSRALLVRPWVPPAYAGGYPLLPASPVGGVRHYA